MHLELASGTPAFLARAADADHGLVVIPDIWGLRPLFEDMCTELSLRTGWSVISFEPFPGQTLAGADSPDGFAERSAALGALADTDLLADAVAAADAVVAVEESVARTGGDGPPSVGLIGFCMGGMYAYKAAATGRFDRIVGFYGMIHVPDGWAGAGQAQPLDAVRNRGRTEVMGICGTIDPYTPPDAIDELEAAGATVVRYDGADHGFVHDPARPTHRAEDAADAWDRALGFLREGPVRDGEG